MRGVSTRAVKYAKAQGRISVLPGGRIDPETADRAWAENSGAQGGHAAAAEERRAGGASPRGQTTYAEARRIREIAKARLATLDVRQREGELVEAAAVAREWFRICRTVRDRMVGLTDRLAPYAVAETDLDRMRAKMDAEIEAALAEVSGAVRALGPPA